MRVHQDDYEKELPFTWTSRRFYGWDHKRSQDYYNIQLFKIIHKIIKNNIGKSFNLTFKYFCKKYPNIRQDLFLNEFEFGVIQHNKYCWKYLVKDGVIYGPNPFRYKKDKSIVFKSFDHKEEKQFESKKDKEFIRLMYEKNQAIKRSERLLKIEKKNKEYSFLSKSELEKLKSKDLDIIKRDSKGFNEESFKGDFYHGRKNKRKNKTIFNSNI